VSRLHGKFARLIAVLVLMTGLIGASMPGFAAMPAPAPQPMPAAMDCDHATHDPAPQPHAPAPHAPSGDCCLASICAMNLALPTLPSGLALPVAAEMPRYDLRALRQPPGIVTAPIPHPPKTRA
jgi:hypothetical protein